MAAHVATLSPESVPASESAAPSLHQPTQIGGSRHQSVLQLLQWTVLICRENASEPDTRDRRARSHSDRACPGVRRTFVPRFGMAFGLVCPSRRRHLACRSHRLVDRVEGLGLSDGAPSGTCSQALWACRGRHKRHTKSRPPFRRDGGHLREMSMAGVVGSAGCLSKLLQERFWYRLSAARGSPP